MKPESMNPKPLHVFLDFDGVTHTFEESPSYSDLIDPENREFRGAFSLSNLIEFVLHRYAPSARVVLSTSWRTMATSTDEMKQIMLAGGCNPALVNRVVGMTKQIEDSRRVEEVVNYIDAHGLVDTPCVAIDDAVHEFIHDGEACPDWLIAPAPSMGFFFNDAYKLAKAVCAPAKEALIPYNWFNDCCPAGRKP